MKKKRKDHTNTIWAVILGIVLILGFYVDAFCSVNSVVQAMKKANGVVQNMNKSDSGMALVRRVGDVYLMFVDSTGGDTAYIRYNATLDSIQYKSNKSSSWLTLRTGVDGVSLDSLHTVISMEMGAGGLGDITGATEADGISLTNADGPGAIGIGANFTFFRAWIDSLDQVKIAGSDSTEYAKGFRYATTGQVWSEEGDVWWDSDDDQLGIYSTTGATDIYYLKEVPDSSSTSANIASTVLGAIAARNSANAGEVPVYRPSDDSLISWEVATGGVSSIKLRGTETATGISTIDLATNTGWVVTESPDGEANISYDFTADKVILSSTGQEVTGTLPLANGGTNNAMWLIGNAYAILYYDAANQKIGNDIYLTGDAVVLGCQTGVPTPKTITGGAGVDITTSSSAITMNTDYIEDPVDLDNAAPNAEVTGTLPVENGGTEATTFTGNTILAGNGTNAIQAIDLNVDGQLLIGSDTGMAKATITAGTGIDVNNGDNSITIVSELGSNIDSTEIVDEGISFSDIGQNTAADGEVITWNTAGDIWVASAPPGGAFSQKLSTDEDTLSWIPVAGDTALLITSNETDDTTKIIAEGRVLLIGEPALVVIDSLHVLDTIWVGSADSLPITSLFVDSVRNGDFGAVGEGTGDTLFIFDDDDAGTGHSIVGATVKIREGLGIMITHEDSTTFYVSRFRVDTANVVADGETKPVTGNAVYDFCETTRNYALNSELHTREHSMTGTSDHNATAWRMFYSDGSGDIQEIGYGTSGYILTSNGTTAAPAFKAETDPTLGGTTVTIGDGAGSSISLEFDGVSTPDGSISWSGADDKFTIAGLVDFGDYDILNIDSADIDALSMGVLTIPNGANPTTAHDGKIAYDTDEDAIEVYTGATHGSVLIPAIQKHGFGIYAPGDVDDTLTIFVCNGTYYPAGIKLVELEVTCNDSAGTYALQFEEWTGKQNRSRAGYVDTLTVLNDYSWVNATTLNDADIAAGNSVRVIVPSTAKDEIYVQMWYYVKEND